MVVSALAGDSTKADCCLLFAIWCAMSVMVCNCSLTASIVSWLLLSSSARASNLVRIWPRSAGDIELSVDAGLFEKTSVICLVFSMSYFIEALIAFTISLCKELKFSIFSSGISMRSSKRFKILFSRT